MHRRGTGIALAGLALSTLLITGCAGSSLGNASATGDGTVHIGLIWPQSGVYKTVGDDFANGWQLYLDTHGGKLGGHTITTDLVDEGDGKQDARNGIKKLIEQDHSSVVVGTISSDAVQTVQPMLTSAEIPYVATGGRPGSIKDLNYTWHTSWLNRESGQALAPYMRSHVDGPVYAIGPDYKGGWDIVNGFVDAFTAAGGKLANPDGKPTWTPFPDTTNFLPYLNQIASSGAKAVYCFYSGTPAINFVKQYAQSELKGKIPLYAAGFTTEGAVLAAQGAAADGVYTSLDYAPDLDNAENRAFATAFREKYHATPDLFNVTAYDAALVLDKALAAAGPNPTSASINAAIGKLGAIDSPRGPWRFGTDHTPIQRWYLRQVRNDGHGRANVVIQTLSTVGN